MLSSLELLERERLNHLHFIEKYSRDPETAQYVWKEVEESHKQLKRLNIAIQKLSKEWKEKNDTKI